LLSGQLIGAFAALALSDAVEGGGFSRAMICGYGGNEDAAQIRAESAPAAHRCRQEPRRIPAAVRLSPLATVTHKLPS
jgi:hypothetical protein